MNDKLRQKIYEVLIHDKKRCKFKDSVNQAFKPFILIDPDCKADDIAEMLRKEK